MDIFLQAIGRKPDSLIKSFMTGMRFGCTQEELIAKLANSNQSAEDIRKRGIIVGVGDELKAQLLDLEKVGLQRIMLQWLELEDLDGLSELAKIFMNLTDPG